MIENLQTVLFGKAVDIKGKHFLSTAAYLQPFIDRLKPFNVEFSCNVKLPDVITINDSSEANITYTRVSISAIFPKEPDRQYRKILTMSYGLDIKVPLVKFYVGALLDDNSFVAFDKEAISIQELEPDTPINYSPIRTLLEKSDNINTMITSLQNVYIHKDLFQKYLGEWIDFTIDACYINPCGKVKLASTMPIDVYKMIIKDSSSDFYIHDDFDISIFDVYNAFLTLIRDDDKDIINRFEKTFLVDMLLKL